MPRQVVPEVYTLSNEHRLALQYYANVTGRSWQDEVHEAIEKHISCAIAAKLQRFPQKKFRVVSIDSRRSSHNDKRLVRYGDRG